MNKIPGIPPFGYRLDRLDVDDYNEFVKIVTDTIWTIDPDGRYKHLPMWANHQFMPIDDLDCDDKYEFTADKYIPEEQREFGHRIINKYFPEIGKVGIERVGITLWNGAEETGWHTDDDGTKQGSTLVCLLYHVPKPLKFEDGGRIHFGQNTDNGIVENSIIIPYDGMILALWVDKEKYSHKAITTNSDRYTMLIGVVEEGRKAVSYKR